MAVVHETDIWTRIISTSWSDLPPAEAHQILRLGFSKPDLKRMEKLGELAQSGELSAADRSELQEYLRVSHVLMLMKARARKVVRGNERSLAAAPTTPARRRRAS